MMTVGEASLSFGCTVADEWRLAPPTVVSLVLGTSLSAALEIVLF